MPQHRVLMMCFQQFLGEITAEILRIQAYMELIGTCGLEDNIDQRVKESE